MSDGWPSDDHELWRRVQMGDREAFDALFTRHHAAVFGYAFRLTGDRHHAEDVVSQTFLDTWRRREHVSVEPGARLLPWLIAVAHRVADNVQRSRRRWLRLQGRAPAELSVPDHAGDVADRVDDELLMRSALALVKQLPDHERAVFMLCVWGEQSYADAAVVLAVPVGTVRSRLSRARARLRDMVTRLEDQTEVEM